MKKIYTLAITILIAASFSTLLTQQAEAIDTKYENYWTQNYDTHEVISNYYVAQTFTTTSQHNVNVIVLWFNRVGSPGLFNVSIRETDTFGVPTNVNLASSTNFNGTNFVNLGDPTRVIFSLTPEITLNANTKYAIVVSRPVDGDEGHQLRIATGWNTYAGGNLLLGTPNGQNWDDNQALTGEDAYFEIWTGDAATIPELSSSILIALLLTTLALVLAFKTRWQKKNQTSSDFTKK